MGPNIPSRDIAYNTRLAPIKHERAALNDDRIIPINIIGGLNSGSISIKFHHTVVPFKRDPVINEWNINLSVIGR